MPIAIWPPGNPVRFSYWDTTSKHRRARRSFGVVVEAEYVAGGYVAIQDLDDLTIHRFQFDSEGDFRRDAFPHGEGHGEPDEAPTDAIREFIEKKAARSALSKGDAHYLVREYLKRLGTEHVLA